MKGKVIAEKYGVNQDYFEEYAQLSGIGHRSSFSGFSVEDEKVADAIKGYTVWLNNKVERDAQEKIARAKMEDASNRQTAENNKKISDERE